MKLNSTFLTSSFLHNQKSQDKNLYILRTNETFKVIFKEISVVRNSLAPGPVRFRIMWSSWNFLSEILKILRSNSLFLPIFFACTGRVPLIFLQKFKNSVKAENLEKANELFQNDPWNSTSFYFSFSNIIWNLKIYSLSLSEMSLL